MLQNMDKDAGNKAKKTWIMIIFPKEKKAIYIEGGVGKRRIIKSSPVNSLRSESTNY